MRLFTGLSVPAQICDSLGSLIEKMRDAAEVRWSPAENLHITTKFIGEWPEARLPELEYCLSNVPRPAAFDVTVAGFGYLPDPQNPKVFFAEVRGGDVLRQLAADTDRALAALGIKPESRPYTPHLTLARLGRAVAPLHALRQRISELAAQGEAFNFGSFEARDFHLYLSRGGAYTKLNSYPLEKAAL